MQNFIFEGSSIGKHSLGQISSITIVLVQHLVPHKCTTTTGGAALAVEFVNLLSFEACSDISCTCALLFFYLLDSLALFLSYGTCSDLRRTMCNTISPLLAKRCVFNKY